MKYQNFHLKLPILQILKSLQNAWTCLRNVICHFDEIIIISTKLQKLKTAFCKTNALFTRVLWGGQYWCIVVNVLAFV